jgi:predicted Holliday junction resolvase-like endonuclease
MFGIPLIYLKIAGWVALVAAVYGGYSYVRHLQHSVTTLKLEQQQLKDMNETLSTTIAESQRMQQVRDEVGSVSRGIREQNRVTQQKRETVIVTSVREGKDREVGPLLKEFFNAG